MSTESPTASPTATENPTAYPTASERLDQLTGYHTGTKKRIIAELMMASPDPQKPDVEDIAKKTNSELKSVKNVFYDLRKSGFIAKSEGDNTTANSEDAEPATAQRAITQHQPQPSQETIRSPPPAITSPPPFRARQIPYTDAFEMFELGEPPATIMRDLQLDADQILEVMKKYNDIKTEAYRKDAIEARYLPQWMTTCKLMGESTRNGCQFYNDEVGLCVYWDFSLEPDMRKKFAGMFKVFAGKLRPRVLEHSEICAVCNRAMVFREPPAEQTEPA